MDVPVYAIESAYDKDNIEVASGTNWILDEVRETTPIAVVEDPVAAVLPEKLVVVQDPLPASEAAPASAVVHFDTGRYALKSSEKDKLDALPVGSYKVYGYADPRGTQKYNYSLSISRARTVAKYLKSEGSEVVELLGFGEKERISKNKAEYSLDRRVEVKSEDK